MLNLYGFVLNPYGFDLNTYGFELNPLGFVFSHFGVNSNPNVFWAKMVDTNLYLLNPTLAHLLFQSKKSLVNS